jgi:hypothetical protein
VILSTRREVPQLRDGRGKFYASFYYLVVELRKGVEKTQSMAGFYAYDQNCQNVDGIAANVK